MYRRQTTWIHSILWALFCGVAAAGCVGNPVDPPTGKPKTCFLADFTGELREGEPRNDGFVHVDTKATVAKLQELHVQTYFYLIAHAESDWDDLKEFLPAAAAADIDVYVYLLAPSECAAGSCSKPFEVDYVQWAREIALLSVDQRNLKGWTIDDFTDNLGIYNTAYLTQMLDEARTYNPDLRFLPLIYFGKLTPTFTDAYGPIVDGIILAYRDDPYRNTQRSESLPAQIVAAGDLLNPFGKPLYLMIMTDALSRTPMAPKPDYVSNVMNIGLQSMSDKRVAGMITYNLRKDGIPAKETSNPAHGGHGHYTIGLAAGVTTAPSTRGGITQMAVVDKAAATHRLSFWHKDPTVDPVDIGRAKLELLVDGKIAWQEDLAASTVTDWVKTDVDIDTFLGGGATATIAFDLVDTNPADKTFMVVRLDDITPEGLTLQNEGFEMPDGWQFAANDPAVLGAIDVYDVNRTLDIFNVVKTGYSGFKCE